MIVAAGRVHEPRVGVDVALTGPPTLYVGVGYGDTIAARDFVEDTLTAIPQDGITKGKAARRGQRQMDGWIAKVVADGAVLDGHIAFRQQTDRTIDRLCPIARCAKQLLNGPCGGSTNGKCEISKGVDCVWQLIIDRLARLDRLEVLEEIFPVKDWSPAGHGGPRKMVREDLES